MDRYNRPIQKLDLEMDRYKSPIQKSDLETDRYNRPIQKSDLETDRYNWPIQKSELKIYRLCPPIQSEDRIGIVRSDNRTYRPPLIISSVAHLTLQFSKPTSSWRSCKMLKSALLSLTSGKFYCWHPTYKCATGLVAHLEIALLTSNLISFKSTTSQYRTYKCVTVPEAHY